MKLGVFTEPDFSFSAESRQQGVEVIKRSKEKIRRDLAVGFMFLN
jgi:hypothetical protein